MVQKDEEKLELEYGFFESTVVRKVQHFYISSAITEPVNYIDMVHRILTSGPEDVIYIHLNTPGGHLDTGMQIVNAMQATQAHVIVSVEAEAHSLGTLIFLAADEYVVHDNVMMMFHNFSGGVFGKSHEQTAQLEGTIKWFNTLARKLYIPFLSTNEFERILKGEDLYLHSDEIRKRLDKMVKQMEKDERKKVKKEKKVVKIKASKKQRTVE